MVNIASAPISNVTPAMLAHAGGVLTQPRIEGKQPEIWYVNVDGTAVRFELDDDHATASIAQGTGVFEREKVRLIRAIVQVGCRLAGEIVTEVVNDPQ